MAPASTSYSTTLWRAWRLRCPRCGQQKLFAGPFRMHTSCATCGLKYEREPGYFLGSIYFNYGLTAVVVAVGYPALVFSGLASPDAAFWIIAAFAVLFPLFFFRYARSLWLGFDNFWDPNPAPDLRDAKTRGAGRAVNDTVDDAESAEDKPEWLPGADDWKSR